LVEVFALARKLLSELANTTLEQSLVAAFIAQLQAMDEDSQQELIQALSSDPAGGLISSAFELDAQLPRQLQDSVDAWAGAQIPLKFETNEQLICGFVLIAQGRRSTWNISAYLEELQASLSAQVSATNNSASTESADA